MSITTESTATTTYEGFSVGDRVVVLTAEFNDTATPGDEGTVERINALYLEVRFEDGLIFPFRADEIGLVPVVEAPEAPEVPSFANGQRVFVPADITTRDGGPVYYDDLPAEGIVVDDPLGLDDTDGNVVVEVDGLIQYVDPALLTLVVDVEDEVEEVEDTELVGATVEDLVALASLPNGTVIVAENTGAIAHRIAGDWVTVEGTDVTGLVTLGVILGAVVTVAYLPSN